MVDFNGNVNGKNIRIDNAIQGGKKSVIRRSDYERTPAKDEVSFGSAKKTPSKEKKSLADRLIDKMSGKLMAHFIASTDSERDVVKSEEQVIKEIPQEQVEETPITPELTETSDEIVRENPETETDFSAPDTEVSEIPYDISGTEVKPADAEKTSREIIAAQVAEIDRLKEELEVQRQNALIWENTVVRSMGEIKQLTEALEQANTNILPPSEYKKKYEFAAAEAKLNYSSADAPSVFKTQRFYSHDLEYKIQDVKPFVQDNIQHETLNSEDLKHQFHSSGRLIYTFPSSRPIKAVKSENAYIKGKNIPDLGVPKSTGMTVGYGKRINWSSQKIARDIMQNFYDGHENTLDGVKMAIEKLPNGKTKVRISGQGLFAYDNLQYLGSGSKETNPYNAGGFGEGSRILVANMLASGAADKITYSSADWKLTFDAQKVKGSEKDINVIMQTLTEREDALDGNCIEFETTDSELTDAIIDSSNYFEHSKNADFKNLAYDSKDFAFKFHPGSENGNLYMTQRFEFEGPGKWDKKVENLTVIFKRKPDADKFKEITGAEMPKDRDRTSYSYEDIRNLTHYFAHDMSDDNIMKTIISTKPLWNDLYNKFGQNALKSFIEGMLDEAASRRMKLNTGDERYVYKGYANETALKTLREYGYTVLPDDFKKIGLLSAADAFTNLSAHKVLEPTPDEVKKLKLLEEGVALVYENIREETIKHLKKAPALKLNVDYSDPDDVRDVMILATLQENKKNPALKFYYKEYSLNNSYSAKIEKMTPEEIKFVVDELVKGAEAAMKKGGETGEYSSREMTEISSFLLYRCATGKEDMDVALKEYFITLKDLNLITKEDIDKPRFIFDRHKEIAENTLGEAIISSSFLTSEYKGHWVDKEYLDTADFQQILGTWLHEICHKAGGDGSSDFTYALTDLCRVLLRSGSSPENSAKMAALEDVYNNI